MILINKEGFPKEIIFILRTSWSAITFFERENLIVDETSTNVNVLEHPNAREALKAVSGTVAGKEGECREWWCNK